MTRPFHGYRCIAALLCCLGAPASAQLRGDTCLTMNGGGACSANDVKINAVVIGAIATGCVAPFDPVTGTGDQAVVDLTVEVTAGGSDRYDIGVWLAEDGISAYDAATCTRDWLNDDSVNLPADPDICDDIVRNSTVFHGISGITIPCIDSNADGTVDWEACASWKNGTENDCNSIAEATPGTGSKCRCEPVDASGLTVPEITVAKSCVPGTARPGEIITCTIDYENLSTLIPGDFIEIVDDFDETAGAVTSGPSIVSSQGTDTVSLGAGEITITPTGAVQAANLGLGASGTVTYEFTLDAGLPDGSSFDNTVCVHSRGVQKNVCITETTNVITTAAMVRSLAVREWGGERIVSWETTAEEGTVGFHLERWSPESRSFVRLTGRALPALQGAPQGGLYRFREPGGPAPDPATYRLVEIESGGTERLHGPFRDVVAGHGAADRPLEGAYEATPRAVSRRTWSRLEAARSGSSDRRVDSPVPRVGSAVRRGAVDRLRIRVRETGLYTLAAREIAEALEWPPRRVREAIRRGRFALQSLGRPVSWWPGPDDRSLRFYGVAPDSVFTRDAVYWLGPGRGRQAEVVDGGRPGAVFGQTFESRVRSEEDVTAVLSADLDPLGDLFFWRFVAQRESTELALPAPHPSASGEVAALTLHLLGVGGSRHRAAVSLNDLPVGEIAWTGSARHAATLQIDGGLLRGSGDTVTVSAAPENDIGFWVDALELDYRRRYRAVRDRLDFSAAGHRVVTVEGFSSPDLVVLEVSDPSRPRLVESPAVEPGADGFRLNLETLSSESRYYAAAAKTFASPPSIEPVERPGWWSEAWWADYVVITTPALVASAEALADLRSAAGLVPLVVTTQEIYDELSHGVATPLAIRAFVARLEAQPRSGPRYLVLAGAGTYDYRDLLGVGNNLVPPLLARSPYGGLVAADGLLADVRGDDGLPEIAVGRIPVLSATELEAYVEKLRAHEAAPWESALVLADDADRAGDFARDSEDLAELLPRELTVERVFLGVTHSELPEARQAVIDGLNAGASIVSYLGHAGLQSLAAEGLFDLESVDRLDNPFSPMVFLGLTCNMGRFELPLFDSLADRLVLRPAGGAVAVWSPTSQSVNARAKRLGEEFLLALRSEEDARLGDLVLRALRRSGSDRELSRLFNLLGDPALVLGPRP